MVKNLSVLFLIVALANLIGELTGIVLIRYISKPLLMIVLTAWYSLATAQNRTITHKLLITGFIFSWAGDVFLMFTNADVTETNELLFLLGLASFLVTHILYVLGFQKEIRAVEGPKLLNRKPHLAIPVLLLFGGLMFVLYDSIEPAMKVPVIVYASVITLMVLNALNRNGKVSALSFKLVLTGAVLFMISDSLIAINKFVQPIPMPGFFIMLLYIAGQYLIARGTINNKMT